MTGLELESLAADLQAFVPGRQVDDNGHVMLRFQGGARGMLWCSQVAPGNENNLRLRVYGDKGGLEWAQEDPNYLWFTPFGAQKRLITRGGAGASEAAARVTPIPKPLKRSLPIAMARPHHVTWSIQACRMDSKAWPLWTPACARPNAIRLG